MRRRTVLIGIGLVTVGCATQSWQQVKLDSPSYDNEAQDLGVAPTNLIRTGVYEAPTPTHIDGATTVTTPQLRDMMLSSNPPIVIDVLGGNPTVTLPGAVWLRGAGVGTSLDDSVQQHLAARLIDLSGGNKAKPIAFLCLSQTCWLSHNAAVRAVALGYSNILWYRGGRNAWQAAGLAMDPVHALTL